MSKALTQLQAVCERLEVRLLSLWDAEDGCAPFIVQTSTIACDKLIRVRLNRGGTLHPQLMQVLADPASIEPSLSSTMSKPGGCPIKL